MEFRVLGPLEVSEHDRPVPLGGPKQRSVLALLLLHANETVSTDRIQAALWGDTPPANAAKSIQVHVSRLRRDIGHERLATRAPGYVLRVAPGELDLARFELLVEAARTADPPDAAAALREALALFRGEPLADLAYAAFAQPHVARLEDRRLAALEARIDADLATGRHGELAGELEALVREHPLRERLRAQLMLALYRSGRQSDALDAYRDAHARLREELGLEPGAELQVLQHAILRHDPALAAPAPQAPEVPGGILVFASQDAGLDALLELAAALARPAPAKGVLLTRAVPAGELEAATAALARRAEALRDQGVVAHSAAFASPAPGEDVARLAARHGADLLLTDAGGAPLQGDVAVVIERAACDVAVLLRAGGGPRAGPVVVPFGAAAHDWGALELATRAARALGTPLRLAGAASDGRADGRDASWLLADASLIVQRQAGIAAQPLLAAPGRRGLRALAEGAGLLVVGLSERWREDGLGRARAELAAAPPAPTVLVRRGGSPGGLEPAEERTRFGWSLTRPAA